MGFFRAAAFAGFLTVWLCLPSLLIWKALQGSFSVPLYVLPVIGYVVGFVVGNFSENTRALRALKPFYSSTSGILENRFWDGISVVIGLLPVVLLLAWRKQLTPEMLRAGLLLVNRSAKSGEGGVKTHRENNNASNSRGIIVCAGGFRAMEAFATLVALRDHEKREGLPPLPCRWYYVGEEEMSKSDMDFVASRVDSVTFIDCAAKFDDPALLRGWPIKAFAFRDTDLDEFVFLDTDSAPMRALHFLFEHPMYAEKGNLFWPDVTSQGTLNRTLSGYRDVLSEFGTNEDLERLLALHESETGQLVVDKRRHGDAVETFWDLNRRKDVFYNLVYGDKDLFAIAFFLRGKISEYSQVPQTPLIVRLRDGRSEAFGQRDPASLRDVLFVHRTHQKRNCISKTNPCRLICEEYGQIEEELPGEYHFQGPGTGEKRDIPSAMRKTLCLIASAETDFAEMRQREG
jgi:hypothetical protein